MKLILRYFNTVDGLSRVKLVMNVLLMVVLGTIEGIGVLLIIPLLYVSGIFPGIQTGSDISVWTHRVFDYLGIGLNLPIVLAIYIGLNVGQSWLQRYQSLLNLEIQQAFSVGLSIRLFQLVVYANWQLILSKAKTSLSNMIIAETTRVYMGVGALLQLTAMVMVTAVQVGIAMIIAPWLTLLVMAGAILMGASLHGFTRRSREFGKKIGELSELMYFRMTEHMSGIKEVKSYGVEAAQVASFQRIRLMLSDNYYRFFLLQTQTDFLYKVGATLFISLFLYSALELFKVSPMGFIVVSVICARLWPKISAIQKGIQNIANVLPAFENVYEMERQCIAARENILDMEACPKLKLEKGIEYRDVSFYYQESRGVNALENCRLSIDAGTTVALVGASGSGKSTMVDLLVGLLQPQAGEILIDGRPLAEQLSAWRHSIGYVPQDAFLTNASIRENLLWLCPEASEEEMWEALRMAAIDSFISGLPNGLDTLIGDRGVMLSGGERQRVVLARALLRKPTMLILDEATSSLDTENEKRIQQAIESLQGKLTIVVVAHRLSTIRNVDMIVVLEQGKVVEKGNYDSLMAIDNGRFRALACLNNS